jgi:hypothetical protein
VPLPLPELVKHVWQEHRLLFDGKQAQPPWSVIEQLVGQYARQREAAVLERLIELARHVDGETGLARLEELLTAAGARDAIAFCPRCALPAPEPPDWPILPLNLAPGRLSGGGFLVAISETGLTPVLEIATPRETVYRGPEPNRPYTDTGAALLLAGPPVLAALLIALTLAWFGLHLLLPVAVVLLVGLAAYLGTRLRAWSEPGPLDRAIDYAWTLLVPRLHPDDLVPEESAFLAGLVRVSLERGRPVLRAAALRTLLARYHRAVQEARAPLAHLALLWRLAIEDAGRTAHDPVALVVNQVDRCLSGEMPLAFAEHLLHRWQSETWSRGNLARLRVLLAERAFAAGFEPADLVELGQRAPALAEILHSNDPSGLARLRFLNLLQTTRPWERAGPAATVFELAGHATLGRQVLDDCPDLLLYETGWESRGGASEDRNESDGPILVCGRGVKYRGVLFGEFAAIEVRRRRAGWWQEHELAAGRQRLRFRSEPTEAARRLRSWFDYAFNELLPLAPRGDRPASGMARRLTWHPPRRCPRCQTCFVPAAAASAP